MHVLHGEMHGKHDLSLLKYFPTSQLVQEVAEPEQVLQFELHFLHL